MKPVPKLRHGDKPPGVRPGEDARCVVPASRSSSRMPVCGHNAAFSCILVGCHHCAPWLTGSTFLY